MAITQEKALEILHELIKKPETRVEDVPRIWIELMVVFNKQFAPPVVEAKKKRRRRAPGSPGFGWPAGIGRAEYKNWKEAQLGSGVTEGLTPRAYKSWKDGEQTPIENEPATVASGTKPAPKTKPTSKTKRAGKAAK